MHDLGINACLLWLYLFCPFASEPGWRGPDHNNNSGLCDAPGTRIRGIHRAPSTRPAWSDENLANLARSIASPLVFAHVRAATPGLPVDQLRWVRKLWGVSAM